VRSSGESPGKVRGYAIVFDSPSQNLGGFVEEIAPGALATTMRRLQDGTHDFLAMTEHSPGNLLGRYSAGGLKLSVDRIGLAFELELPATNLGRDVFELTSRGILNACSFSFAKIKDSWPAAGKRRVEDMIAFELSLVANPAYRATSVVAVRGASDSTAWTRARLRSMSARPSTAALGKRTVPKDARPGVEWR
jgi:hypothetical protein